MPDPQGTIERSTGGYKILSRFARTKLAVVIGIVYLATDVMAEYPDANTAVWCFLGTCFVAASYVWSQGFVDVQKEKTSSDTIDAGGV